MTTAPLYLMALFFDEIRLEQFGKQSLMGFFGGGELYLLDPNLPVDRLAVFTDAKWSWGTEIGPCSIHIIIPRIDPIEIPVSFASIGSAPADPSPFAGIGMNLSINLRFPPLQVGDAVEVWLQMGEERFPAGRLLVKAPPTTAVADESPDTPKVVVPAPKRVLRASRKR